MSEHAHLPLREIARRVDALPGVRPLRIVPLLMPMWGVEVTATVRESQQYDVLDRYLSRSIAEAGLSRTDELADFLGVEPALVTRAVRHLAGIGHLLRDGEKMTLTPLGRQSVTDGRRYQLARGRRMLLRFDGFTGAPVPYPTVTGSAWLNEAALNEAALNEAALTLGDGTRFEPAPGRIPLPDDAVEALLRRTDVADFTGPVVPVAAEQTGMRALWLPVYVVICEEDGLVFGRAVDGPDPYLGGFIRYLVGNRGF